MTILENTRLSFLKAMPFYMVFLNVPVLMLVTWLGGLWVFAGFFYFLVIINVADAVGGLESTNLDPLTQEKQLFWYTLVTNIWPIAQVALIYFTIYRLSHFDYNLFERVGLMVVVGYSSGVAGIVIAHELIHRPNRFERFLGDLILGTVLYGHFRTEHVLVHHRYVGTSRDAVTARYNESFYVYFLRVIPQEFISAWKTEKALLARKQKPVWNFGNPFYTYLGLASVSILLAILVGGWHGLAQFLIQAFTAVFLLETTNYMQHYGLCRMHLGDGKYEHVAPRHSWNTNQRITNYLMVNLQRHSDHHYKPGRRYPLLQSYEETEAPQLPYGYIFMTSIALNPYLWRKIMNPRVRRWRSMYYPQITDWTKYNKGLMPKPR